MLTLSGLTIGTNRMPTQKSYLRRKGAARLLVCDDQKLVRTRVREMLEGVSSIQVVGEAADGLMVLAKARELKPDLVLMDVSLPGIDGSEATRRLLAHWPELRVLAFSTDSTSDSMRKMFSAGARGYLVKTGDATELVAALEKVLAGGRFISPPPDQNSAVPRHD